MIYYTWYIWKNVGIFIIVITVCLSSIILSSDAVRQLVCLTIHN